MTFGAVAAAGIAAAGSIAASQISANGAKNAAAAGSAAAERAAAANEKQKGVNAAYAAPYIDSGNNSLGSIMGGFGLGPPTGGVSDQQFTHQFDANDLNANLAPNYAWGLKQGQDATNNQSSVAGGLVGGNALKGIQDYTQNYAQNAYQNAFNNYTTNQNNIYTRLANIANIGNTAQMSLAQTNSGLTGNMGSAYLSGGQAQAAGYMGQAAAQSQGMTTLGVQAGTAAKALLDYYNPPPKT